MIVEARHFPGILPLILEFGPADNRSGGVRAAGMIVKARHFRGFLPLILEFGPADNRSGGVRASESMVNVRRAGADVRLLTSAVWTCRLR